MTTLAPSLLAILIPNLELLIIAAVASSLPLSFFLWIRGWLDSVKDESPDQVIADQAQADKQHLAHHGHAHGDKDGHHHAHA